MKRAIAIALSSLALFGQTAHGKDLLGVYEDALKNDPQIREAEATRRAARESRSQAWSQLLPEISGTYGITKSSSDGLQPANVGLDANGNAIYAAIPLKSERDSHGYSVQARQNVFSWANW